MGKKFIFTLVISTTWAFYRPVEVQAGRVYDWSPSVTDDSGDYVWQKKVKWTPERTYPQTDDIMEVRYDGQEQAKKTCVYKRTDPGTEAVASVSVCQGNKIKHTQGPLVIQGTRIANPYLVSGTDDGDGRYELSAGSLTFGRQGAQGQILLGKGNSR